MDKSKSLEIQYAAFRRYLQTAKFKRFSTEHEAAKEFITKFPPQLTALEQEEIRTLLEGAIVDALPEKDDLGPFEALIPKTGWLHDYFEYTLTSEPPAAFHFASAYTVLGAALGRQVFFDKSFYKVYPNVALVLIAPTGKCRKSSATNIALQLARAVGVRVLSERVTPEALVQGLQEQETACGLVYAPELAVFLGKQQYLQGMVPLLTTLFDCPDVWKSTTIMRGELSLTNVALSMLGASTMEWFIETLPREAFSGGFMSRLLFVVQEDTERSFALPIRPAGHLWERLREDLTKMKEVHGEVILGPSGRSWYEDWYHTYHKEIPTDDKFAGYHERKPDHLLRMAFIMRVAHGGNLTLDADELQHAVRVLDWFESKLPTVFDTVATTQFGALHQRIIQAMRQAGGKINHSILIRRLQHMANAHQMAEAIFTLKESETIKEHRTSYEHTYELVEEKKR